MSDKISVNEAARILGIELPKPDRLSLSAICEHRASHNGCEGGFDGVCVVEAAADARQWCVYCLLGECSGVLRKMEAQLAYARKVATEERDMRAKAETELARLRSHPGIDPFADGALPRDRSALYPSPCCGVESKPNYIGNRLTMMHCGQCGSAWKP